MRQNFDLLDPSDSMRLELFDPSRSIFVRFGPPVGGWYKNGKRLLDEVCCFEQPVSSLWAAVGKRIEVLDDQGPQGSVLQDQLVLAAVRGMLGALGLHQVVGALRGVVNIAMHRVGL